MATLYFPDNNTRLVDAPDITAYLKARGVRFERWPLANLRPDADEAAVLDAYEGALTPLMSREGYRSADVVVLTAHTPNLDAIRQKFLAEHTHAEDEVRFFVDGGGIFYFNFEDGVCAVHCEAGDFISVPAGMPHWFDCGLEPSVKAIRIFTDASGWTPHYTHSGIEQRYAPGAQA